MPRRSLPIVVFAAVVLLLWAELAFAWPWLPERVATHFAPSGAPNGWSTRYGLIGIVLQFVAIAAAVLFTAGALARLPDSLINLPNKDYWLSPERRNSTLNAISDWVRWLAVMILVIETLVMTLMLLSNIKGMPRFDLPPLLTAAIFTGPIVGMIAWVCWRFRMPPSR